MAEVLNKKQLFDEKDGVRENFYPITHTDAVLMPDGASLTSIIELLQRDIANIGKTVLEPRGIKLTLTQYANVPENITSDAAIRQYTASHSEIWKSTMSADKNFPVIWKRYKYQYSDNTWDEDFKYELCGSILEGKDGLGYEEIFYYDNKEATPPSIADVNAQATEGYNDKGINFQEDGFLPNPVGNSGTRGWYSSRPTLKPNTAIYSSKRVKTAGVWGRFSAPSLCMEYDNTMASLQINVYKEVPVGQTPEKPSTVNVKLQPANYSGTIVNLSAGWTMDPTTLSGTKIIWQCVGQFDGDGVIIKWDGPIRTTGPQGIPGNDGIRSERMYAVSSTIDNPPSVTPVLNMGDDVITSRCGSWYPTLAQATPDGKSTLIQWMLERTSDRFGNWVSNTDRHGWGEPFIFNQFGQGEPGEDGNGVEFVYILSNSETRPPEIFYSKDPNDTTPPEEGESDYQDWDETEFLPWSRETSDYSLDNPVTDYSTGNVTRNKEVIGSTTWVQWTDDPPQADATHKFLWWTLRKKVKKKTGNLFEVITKKKAWTPYCTPTICTRYVVDGSSTRTLDLENDSDYIYYLKEEIKIDSDGVNTGKLTLQDKTGELEIDEVVVTGKTEIGGDQYSNTENNVVLYSKATNASTQAWFKIGDCWKVKLTAQKYDGNKLRVVLLDAKMDGNTYIDEKGRKRLLNTTIRIPITAHDLENNVTETCIFKIVAIEDLTGDGMIWRYKIETDVSQITKTVTGTKGELLTTTYSVDGSITATFLRDNPWESYLNLHPDDEIVICIRGNKDKRALWSSGVFKVGNTNSKEIPLTTSNGTDLVEGICEQNGAYIELYVNDEDHETCPKWDNSNYYLVDRELLTALLNYQVDGEKGEAGERGPQGPAGASAGTAVSTKVLNLLPDSSFSFNSEDVSTILEIRQGTEVLDISSSMVSWPNNVSNVGSILKRDCENGKGVQITAGGITADNVTIMLTCDGMQVPWNIYKLQSWDENNTVNYYGAKIEPVSIIRGSIEDNPNSIEYYGFPLKVQVNAYQLPGYLPVAAPYMFRVYAVTVEGESTTRTWLADKEYKNSNNKSIFTGYINKEDFGDRVIPNSAQQIDIDLFVDTAKDSDLAARPVEAQVIPNFSKNGTTWAWFRTESIPISDMRSTGVVLLPASYVLDLSPDLSDLIRNEKDATTIVTVNTDGTLSLTEDSIKVKWETSQPVNISKSVISEDTFKGCLQLKVANNAEFSDENLTHTAIVTFTNPNDSSKTISKNWIVKEVKDIDGNGTFLQHNIEVTPRILTTITDGDDTHYRDGKNTITCTIIPEELPGHISQSGFNYYYLAVKETESGGINTITEGEFSELKEENTNVPKGVYQAKFKINSTNYSEIKLRICIRKDQDSDLASEKNINRKIINYDGDDYVLIKTEEISIQNLIVTGGIETIVKEPVVALGQIARTRWWSKAIPKKVNTSGLTKPARFVALGDLYVYNNGEKVLWNNDDESEYVNIDGYKCNKYYDLVYCYKPDASKPTLYQCIKSYERVLLNATPPYDASMSNTWQESVHFDVLDATTAVVEELVAGRVLAESIIVTSTTTEEEGEGEEKTEVVKTNVEAGIINGGTEIPGGVTKGSDIRIFAGLNTETDINKSAFYVKKDGYFKASNGEFGGDVKASSLMVNNSDNKPMFLIKYWNAKELAETGDLSAAGVYIGINNTPNDDSSWEWLPVGLFKSATKEIIKYNFKAFEILTSDVPLSDPDTSSYTKSDYIGKYLTKNGEYVTSSGTSNDVTNALIYTKNSEVDNNTLLTYTTKAVYNYTGLAYILIFESGNDLNGYVVRFATAPAYTEQQILDGKVQGVYSPHRLLTGIKFRNGGKTKISAGNMRASSSMENVMVFGDTFKDWLAKAGEKQKTFYLYEHDASACVVCSTNTSLTEMTPLTST